MTSCTIDPFPRDLFVCYNSIILGSNVATANTKPHHCAAEISTLSWQLIIIDLLLTVKRRARLDHV